MAETTGHAERGRDSVRRFKPPLHRADSAAARGANLPPVLAGRSGAVLYELGAPRAAHRAELAKVAGLDPGYLKPNLEDLREAPPPASETAVEVRRPAEPPRPDGPGRAAFALARHTLARRSGAMLERLAAPAEQSRLVEAMRTIGAAARSAGRARVPTCSAPPPGDMGWWCHPHRRAVRHEYGFRRAIRALVATIVAKFIERDDPKRERCWIAGEGWGDRSGSVFLVRHSRTVGQLAAPARRASARGLASEPAGRRVRALRRQVGYRKIHPVDQQRATSRAAHLPVGRVPSGHRERHRSFGQDLVVRRGS